MNRAFADIEAFTIFLEKKALEQIAVMNETVETAADILYDDAFSLYGNDQVLAPLSDYTQAERVALGYTPNDPLFRTGSLLRDKVERRHQRATTEGTMDVATAAIGSPEKINLFHEVGYRNARTGRPVPPRQVFLITGRLTGARMAQMFSLMTKRAWGS